jgi:hypothetical protein
MRTFIYYFAGLGIRKQILWCYLIWYLVTVLYRFDPSPLLWVNCMGISLIIGLGLVFSVTTPAGPKPDRWQVFRLFLMPFCVSSFSALIKGHEYILVFPVALVELSVSIGACAAFVLVVLVLRKTAGAGRSRSGGA